MWITSPEPARKRSKIGQFDSLLVCVKGCVRTLVNQYVAAMAIAYSKDVPNYAANGNGTRVSHFGCVPSLGLREVFDKEETEHRRVVLTNQLKGSAQLVLVVSCFVSHFIFITNDALLSSFRVSFFEVFM